MADKAGKAAHIDEIWAALPNAGRRVCSRAKATRGFQTASKTVCQLKGALCASLFFISSALADLPLVGVSWQSPAELTAIAALSEQVRYVTRGVAFVEASESAVAEFTKRRFAILCLDRPRAGDRYFITDHLDLPLPQGVELVFNGGGEWVLLRVGQTVRLHELPHFLWPLPSDYSLDGWLGPPRRAPKALQTASPAVAALIEEVAAERLQAHVEALALKDPALGSIPGNLRSRFSVHPEMLESTEYIRSHLAAALGDEAVELHSFPIDSERVVFHTSRRGNEGHTPTDTTAYNVIGTLPGTDPEAGHYIVCAHYDATGVRSAGGWDWRREPAPGADDNASGVALVLESARLLAGQQFPWSILFIAWSGEELGLLGSQAYVDLAAERDDKILGVLNFDMIGFNDLQQRLELVTNPSSQWLADGLGAAAEHYGIGLAIDVFEDAGSRISDHAPFWMKGYDAIIGIENHLPMDSTSYGVREGVYRINSQYHTVLDLPDSINWELVRRTTQLAVATLAQYGLGEGTPNLAVFTGDLHGDREDDLRVRVSNVGLGEVASSFSVRVSRCALDSTGCEVIHRAQAPEGLAPGASADLRIPWQRFGEMVFLVEVDTEGQIDEVSEADNRVFQHLRLRPQSKIAVFPNPFRIGSGRVLRFSGVPLKAAVQVFGSAGDLVWEAVEDDDDQRRLGAEPNEVLWYGVNHAKTLVGNGVYIYAIHSPEGTLLMRDKIAVVR